MPSSIKRGRALLPCTLCILFLLLFLLGQRPAQTGDALPYGLLLAALVLALFLRGGKGGRPA